jgi:Protein of unknown function, DUF481
MIRSLSRPLAALAALVGVAALAAPARAEDPKFTYGKKDDVKDVKKPTWAAKAEAGLVATTGNSKTTTITGSASAMRKAGNNKVEGHLVGTYARATTRIATDANGDGAIGAGELISATATSAKNLAGDVRYDRFLTDLNSLYATAKGLVDEPAGKTFQGGGQVGYSRSLFKNEHHQILGEVGYDVSYLDLAAGSSTTIHSARAFVGYKGTIHKDTSVEASLEGLWNLNTITIGPRDAGAFKDTRLNGLVGLTTNLSSKVSVNVSFGARFDNVPAPLAKIGPLPFAPGFVPLADKLDTTTKASLIVTFL